MFIRKLSGLIVLILSVSFSLGNARASEQLHKYFNDAARDVKATADPVQKRDILDHSFQKMSTTLTVVQSMPLTSASDVAGIERLKATLQDKQNELNGTNGYDRVGDEQLDAFANYAVQDLEQADTMVTISLVGLLVIIIIVFLIAR